MRLRQSAGGVGVLAGNLSGDRYDPERNAVMQTFEEILEALRRLPADERQRLIEELEALDETDAGSNGGDRYAALLALAGTVHSDHVDLSTNKYEHLGAAIAEHKRG
jgi:hypothetical protein